MTVGSLHSRSAFKHCETPLSGCKGTACQGVERDMATSPQTLSALSGQVDRQVMLPSGHGMEKVVKTHAIHGCRSHSLRRRLIDPGQKESCVTQRSVTGRRSVLVAYTCCGWRWVVAFTSPLSQACHLPRSTKYNRIRGLPVFWGGGDLLGWRKASGMRCDAGA